MAIKTCITKHDTIDAARGRATARQTIVDLYEEFGDDDNLTESLLLDEAYRARLALAQAEQCEGAFFKRSDRTTRQQINDLMSTVENEILRLQGLDEPDPVAEESLAKIEEMLEVLYE